MTHASIQVSFFFFYKKKESKNLSIDDLTFDFYFMINRNAFDDRLSVNSLIEFHSLETKNQPFWIRIVWLHLCVV